MYPSAYNYLATGKPYKMSHRERNWINWRRRMMRMPTLDQEKKGGGNHETQAGSSRRNGDTGNSGSPSVRSGRNGERTAPLTAMPNRKGKGVIE